MSLYNKKNKTPANNSTKKIISAINMYFFILFCIRFTSSIISLYYILYIVYKSKRNKQIYYFIRFSKIFILHYVSIINFFILKKSLIKNKTRNSSIRKDNSINIKKKKELQKSFTKRVKRNYKNQTFKWRTNYNVAYFNYRKFNIYDNFKLFRW